jgi:hypothetical protein
VPVPTLSTPIHPVLKRVVDAPRVYVRFLSGIMFLNDDVAAALTNPSCGVVDPTPTLPLERIVKSGELVDDATVKSAEVVLAFPCTERSDVGVEDPIPRRPLEPNTNSDEPDDEAILRIGLVSPAFAMKVTRDDVDVVPIERAESHPEPIRIAVSVATPPVRDPMLRATVVPVAVVEATNGILIPLNIPPAA